MLSNQIDFKNHPINLSRPGTIVCKWFRNAWHSPAVVLLWRLVGFSLDNNLMLLHACVSDRLSSWPIYIAGVASDSSKLAKIDRAKLSL